MAAKVLSINQRKGMRENRMLHLFMTQSMSQNKNQILKVNTAKGKFKLHLVTRIKSLKRTNLLQLVSL